MAGQAGRLIALALAGALLVASGPSALDPVKALAGRYSSHFRNEMADGTAYGSDDVVEIVPVDANHAYVRFSLEFANLHVCDLAGIAERAGNALVYQGLPGDIGEERRTCRLTVRRQGKRLAWDDDYSCKAHCGARGGFNSGFVPWSSKRPITYLARLKRSRQFQTAMSEWRR